MKFRFGAVSMVLLFDVMCFLLLCFYPDVDTRPLLGALVVCVSLVLITYVLIYALGLGDPYPFLLVAMLSSMSIIILYSLGIQQSAQTDSPSKPLMLIAENQLKWFAVGVGIFYISYIVYRSFKKWEKLTKLYVGTTVALFAVTLIFASRLGGARNWVEIGGIGIQPSEIIKLCFSFAMASVFCRKTKLTGFRDKVFHIKRDDVVIAVFVYLCLGLFLIQGELGTAVLFFFVYILMLIAYDVPLFVPLINLVIAAAGVFAVVKLEAHLDAFARAMDRVRIWLDPEVYNFHAELGKPNGTQQIYESLKAICSGGFFGCGLGVSGAHNIWVIESDLVFSAICYEMGIFMGFAIILIYFIFSYRGCKIAMEVDEPFDRALALCIVASIACQAFIIIGGVTKMIPLTGITMPFVSAGGSSMIVSFAMLGILTAISHKRKESQI